MVQSWSCEHTGVFKAGGMDDITTGKQFFLPKPEPCEPRGKLRQRLVKDEGSLVSQVLLAVATLRPLVIRNLIGTETVSKPHQHASGDLGLPSSALGMFYFFRFLMTLLTSLILYSRAFSWTRGPTSGPAGL